MSDKRTACVIDNRLCIDGVVSESRYAVEIEPGHGACNLDYIDGKCFSTDTVPKHIRRIRAIVRWLDKRAIKSLTVQLIL